MNLLKKVGAATVCGLSFLSWQSSVFADSNTPNFNTESSTLTLPAVSLNIDEAWFGNVQIKMDFLTNEFTLLNIEGIDAPPLSANLIPGKYQGNTYTYELSEPSILSDGRMFYTLKESSSGGFSAQIVSGDATNHPDIGSREIVDNLSPTSTYGIVTSSTGCCTSNFIGNGDKWNVNHLIGVRQTDTTLSVTLFSQGEDSSGQPQDFNAQRDGAILTRVIE